MLRVGVIGAGNYGINHIKNVAELDFAEVCAISDKNLETALKVHEIYGGKVGKNMGLSPRGRNTRN